MLKSNKLSKVILVVLVLSLLSGCTQGADKTTLSENVVSEGWDMETDFLIVGGGVAGLKSAIEAADLGIEKVLLIEKLGVLGGSAFVSDGILGGYETNVTKKLDLHIDPKDMYEDQMREKKYNLDPDLTWLTTEKSGETIDWLIDNVGVEFQPEVIVKDGYATIQAMHIVEGGGPGMRLPYDKAIEERKAIEILKDTKAMELIMENDIVIGVIVEKGEDIDFGRTRSLNKIGEGPYYGLKTIFFSSVCHGGITKNANAEVTKIDGQIIPGLYAAGELTTVTNSNGYTISNAITFGRIAAKSAQEYIKSK